MVYLSEFVLIKRKWELDKPIMYKILENFDNYLNIYWMVIFPEGTFFDKTTHFKSKEFAKDKNLVLFSFIFRLH